jgi:ubiquinone/menaquinone biosynthesis C-methylase UbiE
MPTQYDAIAEQYQRAKSVEWRNAIEQYSLVQLWGEVAGRSVLDLACGDGHYTRLLKALGGERVVGLDVSRRMIELAVKREAEERLGVEYRVGDAKEAALGEQFDLVVAAYLLNYAQTPEELREMCGSIARHLKPGGRFVTVNNHPGQREENFSRTRGYGFVKSVDGEIREGAAIRYTFYLEGEEFSIENYHLAMETHEWALREAGLTGVQWHAPQVAPEAAEGDWNAFLVDPPVVLLVAERPL